MQITQLGETAIVLSVSYDTTARNAEVIQLLYQECKRLKMRGIRSIRCGLDALALEWERESDAEALVGHLQDIELKQQQAQLLQPPAEVFRVPVCYDPEYATDLTGISRRTGLTGEEIVELHHSRFYDVWMIGFMPGFPYMGAVQERLRLERKITPDLSIPSGSVAIADEFTGIYPFDSPGGWHVIGRTPLKLVDYERSTPWLFEYGMRIQFVPISSEEFRKVSYETNGS